MIKFLLRLMSRSAADTARCPCGPECACGDACACESGCRCGEACHCAA
jgi:hypothetical protein